MFLIIPLLFCKISVEVTYEISKDYQFNIQHHFTHYLDIINPRCLLIKKQIAIATCFFHIHYSSTVTSYAIYSIPKTYASYFLTHIRSITIYRKSYTSGRTCIFVHTITFSSYCISIFRIHYIYFLRCSIIPSNYSSMIPT